MDILLLQTGINYNNNEYLVTFLHLFITHDNVVACGYKDILRVLMYSICQQL